MLTKINIKRENDTVIFEPVSINITDNVFFTNLDADPDPKKSTHWPEISDNLLGPFPSSNSSQCTVPDSEGNNPPQEDPPYQVTYGCKMSTQPGYENEGHDKEHGIINVFAALAAAAATALPQANVNETLPNNPPSEPPVPLVVGGKSPYAVSGLLFQITDDNNQVIQSGSGSIGPGIQVNPSTDNTGISVIGIPTVVGTYNFTFTVDDEMGENLQQVQYSMKVVSAKVA
jgi:hypothetical protein